ncbi:MAG: hypothetical protein U0930_01100 [Pirellulales bacterium]
MAQRFLQAIGVASILNVGLVAISLVHRHFEPIHVFEHNSEQTQSSTQQVDLVESNSAIVYQVGSDVHAQATLSDPPALTVDESLATQAPLIFSLEPQPPAKEDLLMAELRRQAAEAVPSTFTVEPQPLIAKSSRERRSSSSASETAKPKSALKAKSQALRGLSSAADDLTELLQQLNEEGDKQQAQDVADQIETLRKLMREML